MQLNSKNTPGTSDTGQLTDIENPRRRTERLGGDANVVRVKFDKPAGGRRAGTVEDIDKALAHHLCEVDKVAHAVAGAEADKPEPTTDRALGNAPRDRKMKGRRGK